jgi:hypothetical protein
VKQLEGDPGVRRKRLESSVEPPVADLLGGHESVRDVMLPVVIQDIVSWNITGFVLLPYVVEWTQAAKCHTRSIRTSLSMS